MKDNPFPDLEEVSLKEMLKELKSFLEDGVR